MKNIAKKYKGFSKEERKQHERLYDELSDIEDRVARYVLAVEIVKGSRNIDDFIGV